MAQLNANLILGAQAPQIESPVNNLAKLMQVQGMQQQNQLGQMKMDEARTAGERRNKLAALLQGQYETPEARESALLSGGFMEEATKLGTDRRANQKSDLDIDASRQKLATERYTTFKKTLGALSSRQDLNKDLVMQAGQELVAAGIIPAQMYEQSLANMPDDPNALRQRLREGVAAQMTPEQMFTVFAPKPTEIKNGQTIGFRDMNPNSPTYGKDTGGAPVQMQQTPDSVASNATSRANNANTVGAAREANAIMRDLGAQEKRLKIDELQSEKTTRDMAKEAAKVSADVQIAAIDKAINHPGRSTGTGFSSMADPRNFVPGTDATDFRVVLDQIKGTAFLQAFQSLKGGGAITEMEGKKAEAAIARLDRAQSDKEFETALKDLRTVMVAGKNRLSGNTGGSSASFDSQPAPTTQGGVIDFGSLK